MLSNNKTNDETMYEQQQKNTYHTNMYEKSHSRNT